jgi:hypothetical protein
MAHSMLDTLHDHGSSTASPRSRWLRGLQLLAALALATTGAALTTTAAGCKSTPAFCVGGYVRTVNKVQTCEGLCEPSKCANPGNVCVDNLCYLQCAADTDCPMGQSCLPATTDGSGGAGGAGAAGGTMVTTCQNNGRSAIGFKCPEGNECAKQQPSCPDGSNCDYTQCGGNTCSPDPIACGSKSPCSIGTCGDGAGCKIDGDCGASQTCTDGVCSCGATTDCNSGVCINGTCQATPCTVQGCAMSDCKPLVCLSDGVGDADAYCTLQDCTTDANCPGGYACDKERDPHPICGAAASKLPGLCGVACTADAICVTTYGTGSTCGNITAGSGYCQGPCVMANAGNGTTYAPGPYCTFRNECRIRKLCDPCTADLDCSAVPGAHCTQPPMGTAKFCASDCKTDTDCAADFQCTAGECVPRAGSCTGTGKFCEPCHDDTECATGLYCSRESSGLARICVSPIGTLQCPNDQDTECPTSPSGLHGKCMDESVESTPGDGIYHTCWLPYIASIDSFQCWANNTGAACGVDGDCVSNKCLGATMVALGTCM